MTTGPSPTITASRLRVSNVSWGLAVAAMVVIPLIGDFRGVDSFRVVKLATLRAIGLLIVGLTASWFLFSGKRLPSLGRLSTDVWVALLILGWTLVTTVSSTHPTLSAYSVSTVLATVALYAASRWGSEARPIGWAYLPLGGAVVNVAVLALQASGIWNPLLPEGVPLTESQSIVLTGSALLGNPNDVGVVMASSLILASALTIVDKHKTRRIVAAGAVIVLLAGLLLSRNITSIAAFAVAVVILGLLTDARRILALLLVVSACFLIAYQTWRPLRQRIRVARLAAIERRWDDLFSRRFTAYLAALEMTRRHPLTGVGPGAFAPNYLPYKICVDTEHSSILTRRGQQATNFSEAHNDHLQTLAETGLPGYALMLTVLSLLARPSLRPRSGGQTDERRELARVLSLPLAASLVVLGIAQFPLQLAATLTHYAFLFGLLRGWGSASRS